MASTPPLNFHTNNNNQDEKHILLLGATGHTGRWVLHHALEQGKEVVAIVRNPSKLDQNLISHPRFHLVKGSFTDPSTIEHVFTEFRRIQIVIVMAIDRSIPLYMSTFMETTLVPTMKRFNVKKILYQAGQATILPHERKSLGLRMFRSTYCRWTGMIRHIRDNDAVLKVLVANSGDMEWVVTRPSLLVEGHVAKKEAYRYRALERNGKGSSFGIRFIDLAMYSLGLVEDETAIHSADFVSYVRR